MKFFKRYDELNKEELLKSRFTSQVFGTIFGLIFMMSVFLWEYTNIHLIHVLMASGLLFIAYGIDIRVIGIHYRLAKE